MGKHGPKLKDKQVQQYRTKFNIQKYHAELRGIAWQLTFEEWLNWWGDDITKRGSMSDNLCMCRYGDKGPYSIDNIYKDTIANNTRDQFVPKSTRYLTRHIKKHNRSVTVGTIVYVSKNACARAYNIAPGTVRDRCKSKNFPEWYMNERKSLEAQKQQFVINKVSIEEKYND